MSYTDPQVQSFSLSFQMSFTLASKQVEPGCLISVTDALAQWAKIPLNSEQKDPEMLICSHGIRWQLGQELAGAHSDLLPQVLRMCLRKLWPTAAKYTPLLLKVAGACRANFVHD